MARRKPVTAEDLADLVRRCEDLSADLYDMSDRLDGSFGDAAVRALATARTVQAFNGVTRSASELCGKLIAMRAMDEDARDLERDLRQRLTDKGDAS